jgi:hypothetical protein
MKKPYLDSYQRYWLSLDRLGITVSIVASIKLQYAIGKLKKEINLALQRLWKK